MVLNLHLLKAPQELLRCEWGGGGQVGSVLSAHFLCVFLPLQSEKYLMNKALWDQNKLKPAF